MRSFLESDSVGVALHCNKIEPSRHACYCLTVRGPCSGLSADGSEERRTCSQKADEVSRRHAEAFGRGLGVRDAARKESTQRAESASIKNSRPIDRPVKVGIQ